MQYIRVRLTNALSKPLYINRCIVATSDYPGTRNGYDFEFPATFTRRLPKQTPKVSRFSSDSCLALSLDSSLLVELHGVHDGFRVWGILEIGTRWIVSYFFLSSEKEIGRE